MIGSLKLFQAGVTALSVVAVALGIAAAQQALTQPEPEVAPVAAESAVASLPTAVAVAAARVQTPAALPTALPAAPPTAGPTDVASLSTTPSDTAPSVVASPTPSLRDLAHQYHGLIERRGLQVAARALGLSPDELRQQLGGRSLTRVAQARGVDPRVVSQALVTAANDLIDGGAASGKMSADQAARAKALIPGRVDQLMQHQFAARATRPAAPTAPAAGTP